MACRGRKARRAAAYGEADADALQTFAQHTAEQETDRATYQAMEALIHNLNTMHSRAGAQMPFSSHQLRHGHLARGRDWSCSNLLHSHRGRAWATAKRPSSPYRSSSVKEGVNYNPGDPNYDLFKLACRVSAKRLFPNFSFLDAPFNLKYYKEGHPETGDRLHGLPHPRDRQRLRPRPGDHPTGAATCSFTSINLPATGHQGQGRRGPASSRSSTA